MKTTMTITTFSGHIETGKAITIFSGHTATGKTAKMLEHIKSRHGMGDSVILVSPKGLNTKKYQLPVPCLGIEGVSIFCDLMEKRLNLGDDGDNRVVCGIDEYEHVARSAPDTIKRLWELAGNMMLLNFAVCLTCQSSLASNISLPEHLRSQVAIVSCSAQEKS